VTQTASLPMYDLPELASAHDALWIAIARRLLESGLDDVPLSLSRGGTATERWSDDALLLSQACGYPLLHAFAGKLRVVATPRYLAPGCAGASYSSVVVVRAGSPAPDLFSLRGAVCAVNDRASHSGMNVLRAMIAPLATGGRFFRDVVVTGSHEASIARVRAGHADLCAVDAVTHALLARHRPAALAGTRVLVWSPLAPALPYVTRRAASDELVDRLRYAVEGTMRDPALAEARRELLLDGVEVLGESAYAPIAHMAERAAALGFPELA
jgi:ABC-type phosphate/phosphonate transport system substrate-binding protein